MLRIVLRVYADPGFSTSNPTSLTSAVFNTSPTEGSVDFADLYGELLIPLISDGPCIERLSLNAGARYRDYKIAGKVLGGRSGNTRGLSRGVPPGALASCGCRSAAAAGSRPLACKAASIQAWRAASSAVRAHRLTASQPASALFCRSSWAMAAGDGSRRRQAARNKCGSTADHDLR